MSFSLLIVQIISEIHDLLLYVLLHRLLDVENLLTKSFLSFLTSTKFSVYVYKAYSIFLSGKRLEKQSFQTDIQESKNNPAI